MDINEFADYLKESVSEKEQLYAILLCLEGLISWCEQGINNEQERLDYDKLKQAHGLLYEVFESYKVNY